MQPGVHEVPAERAGDEKGQQDQVEEIHGENSDDLADGSPKYFPDADLFGTLFGREHDQTEKSQAGDGDGEARKQDGQAGDQHFAAVKLFVLFVGKFPGKSIIRINIFIDLRQAGDRLFCLAGFGADQDHTEVLPFFYVYDNREDRLPEGLGMVVFQHADDMTFFVPGGDRFAKGLPDTHLSHRLFVYEESVSGVRRVLRGKVPAFGDLQAHQFHELESDGRRFEADSFVLSFSFPVDRIGISHKIHGVGGFRTAVYHRYTRHGQGLLFEKLVFIHPGQVSFHADIDQVLPIIAQVGILDIVNLADDDDGRDHEDD